MAFLPDGRLLVTELAGRLKLYTPEDGTVIEVGGVPDVAYVGQGGLGDVALHPDFANNGALYLSYAEPGHGDTRGAVVARATLAIGAGGSDATLRDFAVIWRQTPKVDSDGHYAHRIAIDHGYVWISSGERRLFDPAQDLSSNLGKILRLNEDGSIPPDNPFADRGEIPAQVWSLGHRNPLGLAFDPAGRLWSVEMGPLGGDELNRVERGANYGYPLVSDGDHYDGKVIPDHATRPDLTAPSIAWTPVISPSSLMFYDGDEFPQWRGNAFVGGLSSRSLVRIELDGERAREAERFTLGVRVRDVDQASDGTIWILEDERNPSLGRGRLFRLTAATSTEPSSSPND